MTTTSPATLDDRCTECGGYEFAPGAGLCNECDAYYKGELMDGQQPYEPDPNIGRSDMCNQCGDLADYTATGGQWCVPCSDFWDVQEAIESGACPNAGGDGFQY